MGLLGSALGVTRDLPSEPPQRAIAPPGGAPTRSRPARGRGRDRGRSTVNP
jgi:hypothetical protein